MPNVIENSITLYFCPACARARKGSVQLSDNIEGNKVCLKCCWFGPPSRAQQQAYPCKIYKTVEMRISVLMSMWDTFRPEKAPVLDPDRTFVPWFIAIENEGDVAHATGAWIDQALDFLVTGGFLPAAHYKLIADDTTTS